MRSLLRKFGANLFGGDRKQGNDHLQDDHREVQYVFLDVVKYTQGRNIEAQVYIVHALNSIVLDACRELEILRPEVIYLPTGDGICIALLRDSPIDLALELTIRIFAKLQELNDKESNSRRQFEMRAGVNRNAGNIVVDINGNRNVAGRGINMAQRIMSQADGRQILVGDSTFDRLCEREKYQDCFVTFASKDDKHGNDFRVHQYVRDGRAGLDTSPPEPFRKKALEKPKPDKYIAYFIANASKYSQFLVDNKKDSSFLDDELIILLHLLTKDCLDAEGVTSPAGRSYSRIDVEETDPLGKTLEEIKRGNITVRSDFAGHVKSPLYKHSNLFTSEGPYSTSYLFPSEAGVRMVKESYPAVWTSVFE